MASWDRRQEFEEVALVHLDGLYHVALRLCGSRAEAEDLVQETYLKAFRHFDQFDPGTNCRAWLYAILRNTFLNLVKRRRREIPESDEGRLEGAEGSGVMAPIAIPEDELLQHVVGGDLVRALAELPLPFREAILLADLEECTYKEIAQICEIPIGTVMSRLSRGRQLLRNTLAAAYRARKAAGREA